jgi:hypothetical protein
MKVIPMLKDNLVLIDAKSICRKTEVGMTCYKIRSVSEKNDDTLLLR